MTLEELHRKISELVEEHGNLKVKGYLDHGQHHMNIYSIDVMYTPEGDSHMIETAFASVDEAVDCGYQSYDLKKFIAIS